MTSSLSVPAALVAATLLAACAARPGAAGAIDDTATALPATPIGTPGDFDFEHGAWHTALKRRLQPLSGSDRWVEYAGSSQVRPLLGGRANVVELDVTGPQGRITGLSLRLFDTQRQRWTLNYSNASGGTLERPMSGGFGGGPHGVFYSAETFEGRPILVRFVIDVLAADHCRFEQAFSADGGATWEVNWIADDTKA